VGQNAHRLATLEKEAIVPNITACIIFIYKAILAFRMKKMLSQIWSKKFKFVPELVQLSYHEITMIIATPPRLHGSS